MGSSPSSGTTFPSEKPHSNSSERLLNASSSSYGTKEPFVPVNKTTNLCDEVRMEMRQVVTYRNYQARIVFAPSDQRFHASWSIGGSRGKVSAKTLEEAKVKALTKLKLIAEGRFSLASINQREEAKISSALTILRESGYHDLLEVALDYITLKKATSCEQSNNLTQSIHHQNRSTKRISFSEAADQWLCFKRPGWSEINTKIIQTRLVRIQTIPSSMTS